MGRGIGYKGTPEERFWSKVKIGNDDECWEWIAGHSGGYGRFEISGKKVAAHRFSYELFYGAISGDFVVLHECDNPRCVNPKHLRLGTLSDNMQDMWDKGRHSFPSNAFVHWDRHGERNPKSKLTQDDIFKIRAFFDRGLSTAKELARIYSISTVHVYDIVNLKCWNGQN